MNESMVSFQGWGSDTDEDFFCRAAKIPLESQHQGFSIGVIKMQWLHYETILY
jgi:hypothetical protein